MEQENIRDWVPGKKSLHPYLHCFTEQEQSRNWVSGMNSTYLFEARAYKRMCSRYYGSLDVPGKNILTREWVSGKKSTLVHGAKSYRRMGYRN